MNRKVMRKSTLISSIAMLLVAVLALSGVTFAWFSSDPVATAGNINMISSAVTGLYIGETAWDGTETGPASWSSILTWTDSANLTPASCAFEDNTGSPSRTFYTTTSKNPDGTWDGEAITLANHVDAEGKGNFIAKKIWLKADGATTGTKLMMTILFTNTPKEFQRVAVVDEQGNAVVFAVGAYTYNALTTNDLDTNGKLQTKEITTVAVGSNYNLGEFDGTARSYTVYFYFEGQDARCNNANSFANSGVSMTFSLEVPAEG